MWGTLCFRELNGMACPTRVLVAFILVAYALAITSLSCNALWTSDDDAVMQV